MAREAKYKAYGNFYNKLDTRKREKYIYRLKRIRC